MSAWRAGVWRLAWGGASGRMGSSAMMARADFVLYFVFFK
jgi:hypothetical protein